MFILFIYSTVNCGAALIPHQDADGKCTQMMTFDIINVKVISKLQSIARNHDDDEAVT